MGQVYDQDYFILREAENDAIPEMTPDAATANLPYSRRVMPAGGKPLMFHNGLLDWQKRRGVTPLDPPPGVLFDGTAPLVDDERAEKLQALSLPNIALNAAIYIDHKDEWHENYWYVAFLEKFDCWDRELSETPDPPDDPAPVLDKLVLDDALLDRTPLEQRLLFKLGGNALGKVIAHYSVASIFKSSGSMLIPVPEYGSDAYPYL